MAAPPSIWWQCYIDYPLSSANVHWTCQRAGCGRCLVGIFDVSIFLIPEEVKLLVLSQKRLSAITRDKPSIVLEESKEVNSPSDQEKAEKLLKSLQGEE